ncbi:type VI secretion system baseplate subunit TssE [Desulfococcaceae bacterium HSG7]|nr:type VI secretion system baseplate subunit TssE [Desulfococcaceae bacterium HSG7]
MLNERLFERIRGLDINAERSVAPNGVHLMPSIERHLRQLLNIRQGSVLSDPAMGLPDFTDISDLHTSKSAHDMERAIKKMVEKHEPRLSGIRVKFDPAKHEYAVLHLTISARLARSHDVPFVLDVAISAKGVI